jgi:hypothetical protein
MHGPARAYIRYPIQYSAHSVFGVKQVAANRLPPRRAPLPSGLVGAYPL